MARLGYLSQFCRRINRQKLKNTYQTEGYARIRMFMTEAEKMKCCNAKKCLRANDQIRNLCIAARQCIAALLSWTFPP